MRVAYQGVIPAVAWRVIDTIRDKGDFLVAQRDAVGFHEPSEEHLAPVLMVRPGNGTHRPGDELVKEMRKRPVTQVMHEPRDAQQFLGAFVGTHVWLFTGDFVEEYPRHVIDTDRVLEPARGGRWKDLVRETRLLDIMEALERVRIDDLDGQV